ARLSLTSEAFNQGITSNTSQGRIEMTIRKVEIGGPFNGKVAADSSSRRRVMVCNPTSTSASSKQGRVADETACATRIVSTMARRAYRRPATDEDVRTLMS